MICLTDLLFIRVNLIYTENIQKKAVADLANIMILEHANLKKEKYRLHFFVLTVPRNGVLRKIRMAVMYGKEGKNND